MSPGGHGSQYQSMSVRSEDYLDISGPKRSGGEERDRMRRKKRKRGRRKKKKRKRKKQREL